jgi:hypothetical protein
MDLSLSLPESRTSIGEKDLISRVVAVDAKKQRNNTMRTFQFIEE